LFEAGKIPFSIFEVEHLNRFEKSLKIQKGHGAWLSRPIGCMHMHAMTGLLL
jgi:hypothetical protein